MLKTIYLQYIKIPRKCGNIWRFIYFFEWLGKPENNYIASTQKWQECFHSLNDTDKEEALSIIHNNKFVEATKQTTKRKVKELLNYYVNYRDDIITPGTELYKLKQKWDVSSDNPKNSKNFKNGVNSP